MASRFLAGGASRARQKRRNCSGVISKCLSSGTSWLAAWRAFSRTKSVSVVCRSRAARAMSAF